MSNKRRGIFRPMLAGTLTDMGTLNFPVIATPKIDGIRCLKIDGNIVSRSLKPIPNRHISSFLESALPEGADGEIVVGSTFQDSTSGVMSVDGTPNFTYHIFDLYDMKWGYLQRLDALGYWEKTIGSIHRPTIQVVPAMFIKTIEQLLKYEKKQLLAGFEGVMVRSPDGPYKCGRSTEKEGFLLKIKRFADSEAVVIGFEEQLKNNNPKTTNELGLSKRSSNQAQKVPSGTLGKFIAKDGDVEFCIGTGVGLTAAMRQHIWDNRPLFLGRTIKYKFQKCGTKDAPRLPIFLGFRDPLDMETTNEP